MVEFGKYLETGIEREAKLKAKLWKAMKLDKEGGAIRDGRKLLQLVVTLAVVYSRKLQSRARKRSAKATVHFKAKPQAFDLLRPVVGWMAKYKLPAQKQLTHDDYLVVLAAWLQKAPHYFAENSD